MGSANGPPRYLSSRYAHHPKADRDPTKGRRQFAADMQAYHAEQDDIRRDRITVGTRPARAHAGRHQAAAERGERTIRVDAMSVVLNGRPAPAWFETGRNRARAARKSSGRPSPTMDSLGEKQKAGGCVAGPPCPTEMALRTGVSSGFRQDPPLVLAPSSTTRQRHPIVYSCGPIRFSAIRTAMTNGRIISIRNHCF